MSTEIYVEHGVYIEYCMVDRNSKIFSLIRTIIIFLRSSVHTFLSLYINVYKSTGSRNKLAVKTKIVELTIEGQKSS